MRRIRRSIHSPCHCDQQKHACFTTLLPLLRVAVPTLLLLLLWHNAHMVYIRPLRLEIPASFMWVLCVLFHTMACFFSFRSSGRRVPCYELCCCVIATELWLFLYYTQYQPIGAALLLTLYALGWILLETKGRRWLYLLNDSGSLPAFLTADVSSSHTGFLAAARRMYAVMAAAGLLLVPSILTLSCYGLEGEQYHSKLHAQDSVNSDNPMMANISTISQFSDVCWKEMNTQEKLDALQVIADMEAGYLQIEPVNVVSKHLEGKVLGSYDETSRTVSIDFDHHAGYDAMDCLNTLLHECRHAFQHDCVDSLDWSNEQVLTGMYYAQVRQWRQDFVSYTQSGSDQEAYLNQSVEVDAREYADEVEDIYQHYWYLGNLPVR